jgi:integrase
VLKSDGKYQYAYARTYKGVKEKKKYVAGICKIRRIKSAKCAQSAVELFESWLRNGLSKQVKPSTYESYYRCLTKYVIPFFKEAGNNRITEIKVVQFVKRINDTPSLSESYKRKIVSIFKTALREILKGFGGYAQVIEAIRLPKAETVAVQVFTIKEQRLIENAAINSEDSRALGILLCFYTGIRLGELCALKWGDIDFEAGTMSIKRTVSRNKNFQCGGSKTILVVGMPKSQKSVRIIPLPDFLLEISNKMKMYAENENCYVLSGSTEPLDPRTYQKLFKRILKNTGVKDRKFHAIRTPLPPVRWNLVLISKRLARYWGTQMYRSLSYLAHSLMEQKKKAIDKLNELHITHMGEIASFAVASSVITA